MFEYQKMTIKKLPFEGYGDVKIYLFDTENFSLISIPDWNFSFLWELKDEDTIEIDNKNKSELIKVLSVPMGERDAIKLSNVISQFMRNGKWELCD